MYFAILPKIEDSLLPPAVLSADTEEGLREGFLRYREESWECVLLVYGKRIDYTRFYTEEKETL